MKKQRPVNLELSTIRFPAAAISSILHRVSGVIMLGGVGFLVWALATSLQSAEGFALVQDLLTGFVAKFIAWGILTALGYHLLAGVRHMVMDLGHWEELDSGRISAQAVFVLAILVSILVGVWLW
ncbi:MULTISPECIES: succinate dehydrogenase, cytochrome b556 subunit [Idiomarinaceae]|uniref:Succinate dehydrogenase cytochrome b556 subunit n=1 Tax=Pseudidiomarina fusca TaxID=2965078 RepID=A0ABU3KU53_9GAMM|nr:MULTISPECIES: succinate dehydrogenase, cytochrome b556 subunit [Idiomarinaceae]NCU56841.1 succinate dehydrogenase, cytochrome b556 subunit [Idiomarina sp. FenA--70]NCU59550.1 succinate dehydrogenase, cytochrome b556 subunit [Idiomarina sp. FenBw--71]MDT7524675.1 succinate dehydrogenase, cytochrome b556 subunit [Pseudidiomarina sp. GXY010]MRJ41366.1 succinate dehydrogenase, cytochrome b556 subunit [Idiomarina sp. FeN1]UUN14204.1 succinate dehydrogenase, cytochrome b556 subunit [Idiomarina lo